MIYTLFGINSHKGANKSLITLIIAHTFIQRCWGRGKLGSLCGELASTSSMASDQGTHNLMIAKLKP